MTGTEVSPAWASTAVGGVLAGPCQEATVIAALPQASYLHLPEPGDAPPVLSLLSPKAVRLPIGVVVGRGPLPGEKDAVVVGDGLIRCGARAWRPARWWDPRPRLDPADLCANGDRLLDLLDRGHPSSYGIPLTEALAVAASLAAGEAGPALSVIGLGPGLTPAADDVIAGALSVLFLLGSLEPALAEDVVTHAARRTPALSAALLLAATRGQMIPEAVAVTMVVALGGPPSRLRFATAELFAVGGTSGRALFAGMAGALAARHRQAHDKAGVPADTRRNTR